ncbi:hypothetical protein RUM43_001056 [Polyplax serrata]|uniref:Uncharacterized protein n=1 Tax=Polyplax serrata TaxID=468196 RepID=A0AAN8XP23_POLSC
MDPVGLPTATVTGFLNPVSGSEMPHVNSGGGGDDFNNDEVKVFKDEGEVEKNSSENLNEEKSDLIDLTESQVSTLILILVFEEMAADG